MLDGLPAFAKAVWRHWIFLMSGFVSICVSFVERIRHNPIANPLFVLVAVLCFLAACFLAWKDEHRFRPSSVRDIRELLRKGHSCCVTPIVPHRVDTLFKPLALSHDSVTLRSNTDQTEVRIPLARVKELLPNGYKTLVVEGRLQWISRPRRWQFFPEIPKTDFGVPKTSSPEDPRILTFKKTFEEEGFRVYWRRLGAVGESLGRGWQIIYDDDGRYFAFGDSHSEQILMMGKT